MNRSRDADRNRVYIIDDWKHFRDVEAEESGALVQAVGADVAVMVPG